MAKKYYQIKKPSVNQQINSIKNKYPVKKSNKEC